MLGIILLSAWLGIGLHHGLCSVICAFDPRTVADTKSALRLYNVITKLPVALAVLTYTCNCLAIFLISIVAWPYFLMRDLLLAAHCALRPRDLFRRLNTYKDLHFLESSPGRSAITARMLSQAPITGPLKRPPQPDGDSYMPAPELVDSTTETETIPRPDLHTRTKTETHSTRKHGRTF